ncbi:alpha/beta hydrolase family protein [Actinomadura syzygii]|uniref:Alpha/beta hydrolase n=1 Tax=Actinomadura syzygii TaxID=1427538 RepID=A0A5D0UC90_9ACTN|nr:alpha/beta fold hydrolase [Actinomadura syzygii]TYC15390.1 alpha/beta hydrolase [Actinomadura syzygii]
MGKPTTADLSKDLGGFALWPDNVFWSFQFLRLVGQAYAGGADFTECYLAVRDVQAGDVDTWHDRFTTLAGDLERRAEREAAGGHTVSARDSWLRASNYYRAGAFFYPVPDPRHAAAIEARRRCFLAYAEHADHEIERVEVPYGDETLPGYRFSPSADVQRPTPALVIFGGADAVAEEMYIFLGRALTERGFTVLAIDGPGQGEALRRGMLARHDTEVPVGAAVDWLRARPDVDPERIGVVGQSLGGYYAPRAAAFDPRLKACVVWGACYAVPMPDAVPPDDPTFTHRLEHEKAIFGGETLEEVKERVAPFTLEGVAERIACPILILHGESDTLIPLEDARRLHREVSHDYKQLIIYPAGQPGCTHCQVDALSVVHHDIGDWLERVL